MSRNRRYKKSRIPRLTRLHAPSSFFNPGQENLNVCPEPFDRSNPNHIYNPIHQPGYYPEPGEPVTGLGGAFGRHGGNDWGEPFVTRDFFTDTHLTVQTVFVSTSDHSGMLFRGHIPPEAPDPWLFDDYTNVGRLACERMERNIQQGTHSSSYIMPAPSWIDRGDGTMGLCLPGTRGYIPPENVMLEEPPDEIIPRWVHTIYTPTYGPGRYPDPSEPTTGFGGPFTDNRDLPWGPESYMCPDFDIYAHDSGENPGMRFPATIAPEPPSPSDFAAYMRAQDRLLEFVSCMERDREAPFQRSHPIWRGPAAPKWSETGKFNITSPKHTYRPKPGPSHYPEPGEQVTGFGGPFGRHGGNDWGEGYMTDDFFSDAQITDDPGMLFHGHIPEEPPPDHLFAKYLQYGKESCEEMKSTGNKFPLCKTPAWVEQGGSMTFAMPGDPGYTPPRNVMVKDPEGVPKRVKTRYNPKVGVPSKVPYRFERTTGFGGPFTDNRLVISRPWGPDSFMTDDFLTDAHDSGPDPGMNFAAPIPNQLPSEEDFFLFRYAQNVLLDMAADQERAQGVTFDRSHPFWQSNMAPKWSETGKYQGPDYC